ncbi:MAG TPA: hypothetical protein VLM92_14060, partial [Romboutsia sp.]|nr:hypothetical protein [Romboutsia sp.]
SFALYERSAQDLLSKLVDHEKQITDTQANLTDEQINLDTTVKHLASVIAISSQDIEQKLNMIFDYIDIYKEAVTMATMQEDDYKRKYEEEVYDVKEYNEVSKYEKVSQRSNEMTKSPNYQNNFKIKPINKLRNISSNSLFGDDRND